MKIVCNRLRDDMVEKKLKYCCYQTREKNNNNLPSDWYIQYSTELKIFVKLTLITQMRLY